MAKYLLVRWLHQFVDQPILLYSEVGRDCYETRKIEIFRDGRIGLAAIEFELGGSILAEKPMPPIEEIAALPEFLPQEISLDEFEAIWRIALQSFYRPLFQSQKTS